MSCFGISVHVLVRAHAAVLKVSGFGKRVWGCSPHFGSKCCLSFVQVRFSVHTCLNLDLPTVSEQVISEGFSVLTFNTCNVVPGLAFDFRILAIERLLERVNQHKGLHWRL